MNRMNQHLIRKTITLAMAILAGRRVSEERIRRRVEICSRCRYLAIKGRAPRRVMRCKICGCRLKGKKAIVNLARYEENSRYGCKHPRGSRWKKAGV